MENLVMRCRNFTLLVVLCSLFVVSCRQPTDDPQTEEPRNNGTDVDISISVTLPTFGSTEFPAEEITKPNDKMFTAGVEGNASDYTYTWRVDGEIVPGAATYTFTTADRDPGVYNLVVLAAKDGITYSGACAVTVKD
jgi:hypothetical protein